MKMQAGKDGKYGRAKDVEEVLSLALTEEGARQRPEGWQQIVKATKFSEIKTIENPKTKLKTFHATGDATIQLLRLKDDSLFRKKRCKFKIEAEESFDDIGLPDVKVKNLNIIE